MAEEPAPDGFLGGLLRLRQPPRGAHRAGSDAVLLAQAMPIEAGARVVDLGAGTGAVGLAVAALVPDCTVTLVERDAGFAGLARENAALNALTGRVRIVEADVLAPAAARRLAGLLPESADILLTNPPFFEAGAGRPSPNAARRASHHMEGGDLDGWLRACADLLRPGGRLGLIHRADALPACLAAFGNRFGGVWIRPVHPRTGHPAIRVLLTATKGSRAAFGMLPPLVLHDEAGRFTQEAEALHRPAAPTPAKT